MWRFFRYVIAPAVIVVTAVTGAISGNNNTGTAPSSTSSSRESSSNNNNNGNNGSGSASSSSSSSSSESSSSEENSSNSARNVATFRVFAQNMRLLDPHVCDGWFCYVVNAWLHKEVRNTHEDNRERSWMMAKQALNRQTPPRNSLDTFDIVSLQEVFDEDSRAAILSYVPSGFSTRVSDQYTSRLGGHQHWYDPREDDGLLMLVNKDHTVSNHSFVRWKEEVRPDSLAKKGFTLTRVRFGNNPDHFITVVNLHANADHERRHENQATRVHQMRQVRAYINAHAPTTHPVLFTGDYNVDGGSSEYGVMLQNLGLSSGDDFWKSEYPTLPGLTWNTDRNFQAWYLSQGRDNNIPQEMRFQRLDYFMVKQGSRFNIELDSISVVDDSRYSSLWNSWRFWCDGRTGYLSDHYGLKGTFRLVEMN